MVDKPRKSIAEQKYAVVGHACPRTAMLTHGRLPMTRWSSTRTSRSAKACLSCLVKAIAPRL